MLAFPGRHFADYDGATGRQVLRLGNGETGGTATGHRGAPAPRTSGGSSDEGKISVGALFFLAAYANGEKRERRLRRADRKIIRPSI